MQYRVIGPVESISGAFAYVGGALFVCYLSWIKSLPVYSHATCKNTAGSRRLFYLYPCKTVEIWYFLRRFHWYYSEELKISGCRVMFELKVENMHLISILGHIFLRCMFQWLQVNIFSLYCIVYIWTLLRYIEFFTLNKMSVFLSLLGA